MNGLVENGRAEDHGHPMGGTGVVPPARSAPRRHRPRRLSGQGRRPVRPRRQRIRPPGALAMSANATRIRSIHLNRLERPRRATVWTKYEVVKVEWRDVAGNQCWFSSGTVMPSGRQFPPPSTSGRCASPCTDGRRNSSACRGGFLLDVSRGFMYMHDALTCPAHSTNPNQTL